MSTTNFKHALPPLKGHTMWFSPTCSAFTVVTSRTWETLVVFIPFTGNAAHKAKLLSKKYSRAFLKASIKVAEILLLLSFSDSRVLVWWRFVILPLKSVTSDETACICTYIIITKKLLHKLTCIFIYILKSFRNIIFIAEYICKPNVKALTEGFLAP